MCRMGVQGKKPLLLSISGILARDLSKMVVLASMGMCILSCKKEDRAAKSLAPLPVDCPSGSTLQHDDLGSLQRFWCKQGIRKHGPVAILYKNGAKMAQMEFKNGMGVGKVVEWYPNGKKKIEYRINNDKIIGSVVEWDRRGRKKTYVPKPKNNQEMWQHPQSLKTLELYLNKERQDRQQTDKVLKVLSIKPGSTIADIGAGSGFFAWRFSPIVGRDGKVFAVDIDPNAINYMRGRIKKEPPKFLNIKLVLSRKDSITLAPNSLDWAFLCEAHFFLLKDKNARECLRSIYSALKEGGKVAVLEFGDDFFPGKTKSDDIKGAFLTTGFSLHSEHPFIMDEHFLIFTKNTADQSS